MANQKEATLLLIIKTAGEKAIDTVRDAFSKIVPTAGDVVNAFKFVINSFIELGEKAGQFETVKTAFENLAASQGQQADAMLSKMRELSQGTVSDLELMKQANQAMLLGLPVDKFGEMLNIARTSAKATGQSMEFMLNSIVVGLGRGSKLMLDNLGILVDVTKAEEAHAASLNKKASALTEAERKTAFMNEALRVGTENSKNAGDNTLTLSDRFGQFRAAIENAQIAIGSMTSGPLAVLLDLFTQLANFTANKLTPSVNEQKNKYAELALAIGKIDEQLNGLATKSIFNKEATEAHTKSLEKQRAVLWDEISALDANMRAKDEAAKKSVEAGRLAQEERLKAEEQKKLQDEIAAQNDQIKKDLEKDREQLFQDAMKDIKLKAEFDTYQKSILNAKSYSDRMAAQKQLKEFKEKQIDEQAKKVTIEAQKKHDEEIIDMRRDTYGKIATLSSSNNKTLATIGKAAGITQIAIDTPVAIGKALAAFPPPFNFVAAGLVGAAMAAQAARIAGVQLEDGGLVKATMGGTPAILGEGKHDEMVTPLNGNSGQGNITINVYGGMLGDQSSAREFARAVDKQLLELRRRNESVSFDSGLI